LEKCVKRLISIHYGCHLQIDPDPDPVYHFDPDPAFHVDVDPDSTFQFGADPDPQNFINFSLVLSRIDLTPIFKVKLDIVLCFY
jgi:hypothetical protein